MDATFNIPSQISSNFPPTTYLTSHSPRSLQPKKLCTVALPLLYLHPFPQTREKPTTTGTIRVIFNTRAASELITGDYLSTTAIFWYSNDVPVSLFSRHCAMVTFARKTGTLWKLSRLYRSRKKINAELMNYRHPVSAISVRFILDICPERKASKQLEPPMRRE